MASLAVAYGRWLETVAALIEGASDAERRALLRDTASQVYRL